MESNNAESSLSFRSAIARQSTQSSLPQYSDSGSTVDKDNLIDEMQEKFGELLDANQQLGNCRKQVENLKQRIAVQEKTFKTEKASLEAEIQRLNDENGQNKSFIDELQEEIRRLRNSLHKNEQEHIKLKEQMSTNDQISRAEIRDSLETQKKEFQAMIEKKDKEIGDLHKQVLELRAENLTNNDSMIKKHIELEKLTVSKGKLENQFRRLEAEKAEADERAASLRQLIHNMKEEKKELDNKLSDAQQLIEQMKNDIIAQKRTIESQKDDNEELNEKLIAVQEILPEFTDFKQLIDELHDKVELAETLPVEIKKMKRQLSKAIKAFGLTKSQAEEAGIQLNQMQESSSMLQQQNEELQQQNEDLSSKYRFVLSMQGNVKSIESANREFSHRLDEINATLKGITVHPSLRSIIVTAVILKRWRKINGSKKKYETDTRNWWWICGNRDQQRKKAEPIQLINDLLNVKQKLTKKIEGLTNIIKDAQKTHNEHEKLITEKSSVLESQQNRMSYLQEKLENLEEKIQTMIDPTTHAKIVEKYNLVKEKLSETSSALAKSTNEILLIHRELAVLKDKEVASNSFKKNIDQNTQILKDRLSEAQEEVIMLRQVLSTKNREIITLEKATNRIKPTYLTMSDDKPIKGNRQSTEISLSSSISSGSQRPLQERLLAMSRNIN